jgi:hypothetical protein
VVTVPFPSFNVPFHTAEALRIMEFSLSCLRLWAPVWIPGRKLELRARPTGENVP